MRWRARGSKLGPAVRRMESVLRRRGLDPGAARIHADDALAVWRYRHGEVEVVVGLREEGEQVWLCFEGRLMRLPQAEIPPLYRRMLELDIDELARCTLGTIRGSVVLTSTEPLAACDTRQLEASLDRLGRAAISCQERLVRQFDGRPLSEERAETSPDTEGGAALLRPRAAGWCERFAAIVQRIPPWRRREHPPP